MNKPCYQPVEDILHQLETSSQGLSSQQARLRLEQYGPNLLMTAPPVSAWKILIHQFANFIIYLLIFAVLFSILIGEYLDSLVILIILTLNGFIGFVQEYQANRSLEALKKMSRIQATVIRDGRDQLIDAEELVPGDIVSMNAGDKVAADCRLIEEVQLQVDEAALTGESTPVTKQTERLSSKVAPSDQSNMIFTGTAILGGRARAVVTGTGMETEIGKISQLLLETREEKTPLQQRLDSFGRNLGFVIITICFLVFLGSISRYVAASHPVTTKLFLEFAFVSISLAVAAVPTALPAVVTIALSIGTRRLLKKNVLVRQLTSVEALGCCDIICSDKTGTITQNQMTVEKVWTSGGLLTMQTLEPASLTPELILLFKTGLICNNARFGKNRDTKDAEGNPTEVALLISAKKAGVSAQGDRLHEHPFDPLRKCMSIIFMENDTAQMYVKGAPDALLKCCTSIQIGDSVCPLDRDTHERLLETIDILAAQAMRVLAFAYKPMSSVTDSQEQELIFVGLQAMIDPPREEVINSISRAAKAGIRTIMITGDHGITATAIARTVGIKGEVISGLELDGMNDDQLDQSLRTAAIFARVIPEHKQRIVTRLQKKGHIVAMTGDGVNDAPALKKADIGIAVGSGTDVAKEASDFVLLDDSFTSIVDAVEEGRGIYENIQKSIMLLLSGNLMEVLVIFLAVLMGFNLPLTALLLLWINLITDGAPALAYSVDPYSTDIMARPPIAISQGLFPVNRLQLLLFLGITGSILGLGLFSLSGGNSDNSQQVQAARSVLFTYVVLYEMLLVFTIRNSYRVPLFSNAWLWASVLLSLLLQVIILYTPLNTLFHLTPLSTEQILHIFTAVILFGLICFAHTFYTHNTHER